jgi:hypothetical protein
MEDKLALFTPVTGITAAWSTSSLVNLCLEDPLASPATKATLSANVVEAMVFLLDASGSMDDAGFGPGEETFRPADLRPGPRKAPVLARRAGGAGGSVGGAPGPAASSAGGGPAGYVYWSISDVVDHHVHDVTGCATGMCDHWQGEYRIRCHQSY